MNDTDLPLLIHTFLKADSYRLPLLYQLGGVLPVQEDGIQSDGLLDDLGNLAALLYRSDDGTIIGQDWVAPSFTQRQSIEADLDRTGDVCLQLDRKPNGPSELSMVWKVERTGLKPVPALFNGTVRFQVPLGLPHFSPAPNRDHGSEFLLLSTLAKFLDRKAAGTLHLLTERIPCRSCTKVIAAFAQTFPHIELRLAYGYETPVRRWIQKSGKEKMTPPRSHTDFFHEIGPSPRITLTKVFLQGETLHVVETLPGTAKLAPGKYLSAAQRRDHAMFTVAPSRLS
ncbi:MAG: deaminase domain-containing protein [Massilia sp.]